jgi:hypothetical protein
MRETFLAAGLGVINPDDGFDALERILQDGPAAVGYLSANEEALKRMGIEPGKKLVRLAESSDDDERIDALIDETMMAEIFA